MDTVPRPSTNWFAVTHASISSSLLPIRCYSLPSPSMSIFNSFFTLSILGISCAMFLSDFFYILSCHLCFHLFIKRVPANSAFTLQHLSLCLLVFETLFSSLRLYSCTDPYIFSAFSLPCIQYGFIFSVCASLT